MRHKTFLAATFFSLITQVTTADAAPILAGPADPNFNANLAALTDAYQRQQDVFATLENGMSLDVVFKPEDVQSVKDFFAQSATNDFQTFSGKHPYEAILVFDEHADEGNFAGIASVGVAARLMVLKAEGAPAAEIAKARDAAVRVAKAWHVYGAIGGPGIVARGVRRVAPNSPTDPPFPGVTPDLVPLQDANGSPLPADKSGVWRAPVAPGFDGWIWLDDTSKDQVSGYALAAVYLWDALKDDPEVDPKVTDDLAKDMVLFAKELMKVAPELGIDLCIRDADGRLVKHRDLNPRQIDPKSVLPEGFSLSNGFNAALAMGIIRGAYHMSGDPEIGRFYYEDMIGKRDFASSMEQFGGGFFIGAATNYSNLNMLTIALATLGRIETDPYVREKLQSTLEGQYWDAKSDRDVSHVEQAWFDGTYAAFASVLRPEIRDRVINNLGGFQQPPAFQRERINCDDAELAAKSCIGIDGTTVITLLSGAGHNGQPVAKDILPMSIRPDSNFVWRSDPHTVNGAGSTRMNPGGDYLAAYWFARLSDMEDTKINISPHARPALPYTLGGGEGGAGGGGGSASGSGGNGVAPDESGGCGCRVSESSGAKLNSIVWMALAAAWAMRARRQRVVGR